MQGAPAAINASSAAFGKSVSITSAPPVGLTLNVASGPLPNAANTALASYNATQTAASAFVTGILTTGC